MKKFTKISLIASGVLAVVGIAFLISGFVMGVSWQEVEDTLNFILLPDGLRSTET